MATQSWSTRVRHDSDATFREWGSELAARLLAAGLVQTADTGQVNWTTVTRPGTNTEGGYEIWRMNDVQQATAPVFLRIGYGTGSGATSPRIQVTLGTGSDGAGAITGTALTTARTIVAMAAATTDTARQSYLCVTEGFIGLSWKTGSGSEGSFFFCRTCSASGVPSATGGIVVWGLGAANGVTASQALRFAATAVAYTAQTTLVLTALGFNAQAAAVSIVGSDNQAFLGFTITPRMEPLFGMCGVIPGEIAAGNTLTATLVGATPRTYIALTSEAGTFGPISNASNGGIKYAMLWE